MTLHGKALTRKLVLLAETQPNRVFSRLFRRGKLCYRCNLESRDACSLFDRGTNILYRIFFLLFLLPNLLLVTIESNRCHACKSLPELKKFRATITRSVGRLVFPSPPPPPPTYVLFQQVRVSRKSGRNNSSSANFALVKTRKNLLSSGRREGMKNFFVETAKLDRSKTLRLIFLNVESIIIPTGFAHTHARVVGATGMDGYINTRFGIFGTVRKLEQSFHDISTVSLLYPTYFVPLFHFTVPSRKDVARKMTKLFSDAKSELCRMEQREIGEYVNDDELEEDKLHRTNSIQVARERDARC